MDQPEIAYIDIEGRPIAFRNRDGNAPTLVFFPGYASDMEGAKALALDAFAAERGVGMLRFDYSGTGSSGGRFEDGTLQRWLDESLALLDALTQGPVVLIGSSMGGWIALHVALQRSDRAHALVGIAAAPDFTDWGFGAEARAMLARNGRIGESDAFGKAAPQLMTRGFWVSGQQLLLLEREIGLSCPVRLLHGEQDRDVPLDIAFRTMRALHSADVQLTVVKSGDHRLSEAHEIAAILRTVAGLLELNS
jgi:pimeloyl-ACP methyl ester carboxylesterase